MISPLQKLWQAARPAQVKASEYLGNHQRAILTVLVAILALIGWALYTQRMNLVWADWTGFGSYLDENGKPQPGKTLWDWLELLIIPIMVAWAANQIQRSERDSDRKIAKERFEQEQKLADQRRAADQDRAKDQQQETALQDYIDKMTELLLDEKHPLRESQPEDEVRVVARTRTLATLRGLDPVRKGILLKFLHEAELITPRTSKNDGNEIMRYCAMESPVINLSGADLSEAYLNLANLNRADLSGANLNAAHLRAADLSGASLNGIKLNGADLSGANLREVSLNGAQLSEANLNGAYLNEAHLSGTFLNGANLTLAYLRGANLSGTNLNGANLIRANLTEVDLAGSYLISANLTEANLTGANLIELNLYDAFLDCATMPDGKKYDPAIHIIDENGHYVSKPPEKNQSSP